MEAGMRKSLVAAMAASSTAVAGCQAHGEDAGAMVSRNYQVSNFQQIEVAGPYDVDVRTGPVVSVAARGSEKLLERTLVEVRGNKLVIRPQRTQGWFNFGWSHHGKAEFTVTVPQLSGASIAGSGDIRVDKVQGDAFAGEIAGSGGINIGNLEVQQLKFEIAGSGGVKAQAGKTQSAKYEIAGSGDIDARGVAAQSAEVSIAGSGNVRANATGTAKVRISGSGDVDVTGGAKCDISKAGSGDVRCS
jgi:hypothetical protein